MTEQTALAEDRLVRAHPLLESAGYRGPFEFARLTGGANNQVYRIGTRRGDLVLKVYSTHPDDQRDRLGAEYRFCSFAWRHGVHCIPCPIAWDPASRLALYEFVRGRSLRQEEVTEATVREAAEFYLEVNKLRGQDGATELAPASEACFSLEAHLETVERRVGRLEQIEGQDAVDREARRFVTQELIPACSAVLRDIRKRTLACGWKLHAELPTEERCLSPSDFGFHNALRREDGRLTFLDFEYAGWDDPTKTACDFFCQPRYPIPRPCYETFRSALTRLSPAPGLLGERIQLLLPAYRIKWCCILLNEFLPAGRHRRSLARQGVGEEARRQQLGKARELLQVVAEGAR